MSSDKKSGILKEERDHPQMLGSYRGSNLTHAKNESGINSSKFTDIFTGILPNISSKFHHSKSQQPPPPPQQQQQQQQPPSMEVGLENKLVTSVMNGGGGMTINSPHDMLHTPDQEPPVQFPTSSNSMMLNTPVRNRQRNNTAPINWGGVSTPPHLARSDTNYSENSIWSSNNSTIPVMNPIGLSNEGPNNNNNNNNLSVNNQNNNRVRKRSQTLATYNMPQPMMSLPQHPMGGGGINNNSNNNNMMNIPRGNSPHIPMMQDDVDPFSLVWITTNQKNVPHINLAPTLPASNTIAISNIFPIQWNQGWNNIPNLTSVTMATIFSQFGKILSVRTLKGLYMTLIEFESFEHALLAVETMQDKEISVVGVPCKVTFAKILSYTNPVVDPHAQKKPHSMIDEYIMNGTIQFQAQPNGLQIPIYSDQFNPDLPLLVVPSTQQQNRTTTTTLSAEQDVCPFPLPPPPMDTHREDILAMTHQFDTGNHTVVDEGRIVTMVKHAFTLTPCTDMSNFGSMPEPVLQRHFETPKLREIRKSLDNNTLTEIEIEQLALCMLDELPELSLDYLGNTIVQRIYDKCDDLIRDIILRKLKRHLGIFGIHKSGTWVCQKLIKTARMSRHIKFIIEGVEPYCSALFNDQFGNYVIQEVVKFGSPWNQFIFDNILMNFWTICVNRYGVRAIRACLETPEDKISQEQLVIIGSIIVLYSEYLITDHNGTLLITWLLDTSSFHNKYLLLTRHIITYLPELCCHKLGSLTVLKVLNSRGNDTAKQLIIETIFNFHEDHPGAERVTTTDTLRHILRDPTLQGARFVYKMITSRLVLDNEHKQRASQQVKTVLLEEPPRHQHHRLMEEVGLTTATSNVSPRW